jgi:peptidyl-prolyl cis-trans isomerase-like 4
VRIKHTYVLDDPFPDPSQLLIAPSSPQINRPVEEKIKLRIPYEGFHTSQ